MILTLWPKSCPIVGSVLTCPIARQCQNPFAEFSIHLGLESCGECKGSVKFKEITKCQCSWCRQMLVHTEVFELKKHCMRQKSPSKYFTCHDRLIFTQSFSRVKSLGQISPISILKKSFNVSTHTCCHFFPVLLL